MKATVHGIAGKIGGGAVEKRSYGRHSYIAGAHSFDDLDLELPADPYVDLDHATARRCRRPQLRELSADRLLPGGLRRSAHRGRIISVR